MKPPNLLILAYAWASPISALDASSGHLRASVLSIKASHAPETSNVAQNKVLDRSFVQSDTHTDLDAHKSARNKPLLIGLTLFLCCCVCPGVACAVSAYVCAKG